MAAGDVKNCCFLLLNREKQQMYYKTIYKSEEMLEYEEIASKF